MAILYYTLKGENMTDDSMKNTVEKLLEKVDIRINGKRDWDIQVHNPKLYSRVLAQGTLGLGEAYMDGWWDCKRIDMFIDKVLSVRLDKEIMFSTSAIKSYLWAKLTNRQTKNNAKVVGEKHYDVGNDLYKIMLDKRMTYTCGYWKNAKTLNEAQDAKLDLVCKKVKLKPGMKVLDIGCGWGSFAKYAAEKYKVKVVGITISKEQVKLAKQMCKGLDVEIRLQDYRDVNEKFDAIVSLGMFEHVGYKNYKSYIKVVHRCLKDDGLFLLHTIGGNKSVSSNDPWINKYIFPNSMLPSAKQITKATEKVLILQDWQNFGKYYDNTLMHWHENFVKGWPQIKHNYDDRFYRMWTYYLLTCAGVFRTESLAQIQLWQIVYSKKGLKTVYDYVR
jgi:cyclopropane-fatty-acyl-phospholipid synthase